jgi:hypothetical protein
MGNSRKCRNDPHDLLPARSRTTTIVALLLGFLGVGHGAHAESLIIQPTFLGSEQYSDNISLAPSGADASIPGVRPKQDAFVTMLMPGISIYHKGPWTFNLNYQLQGLFYAGSVSSVRFTNQLLMDSHSELLKDSLYMNSSSSIGQYNNANAFLQGVYALDNITRAGNTSTYETFRLNPYWTPHLGGYVDGTVGVSYAHTSAGSGDLSSTEIVGEYANLRNGKEFESLIWQANFFNQDMFTGGGDGSGSADVTYRNYNGQIQYKLFEHIQPFVQAGNFENSFAGRGAANGAENGSYWNAGLIWTPSRKTYFQAGAGTNNYFATVRWSPSRRTDLFLTYRDSDVGGAYGGYGGYGGVGGYTGGGYGGGYGAGYGGGGVCGGGAGSLGGLGGSYGYGGVGGMDSGLGGYGGVGGFGSGFGGYGGGIGGFGGGYPGFGGGIGSLGGVGIGIGGVGSGLNQYGGFNAGTTWNGGLCHRTRRTVWQAFYTEYTTTTAQIFLDTRQPFIPISQPTNTVNVNEIITRKRAQASVSLLFPKSNITLIGYQENADYQFTGKQDVLGMTAFWNWRFARRTTSQLLFAWQSLDNKPVSSAQYSSDFSMVSLGVYHSLSPYVSGGLTYRYSEQSSDLPTASYAENRVMASVFIRF